MRLRNFRTPLVALSLACILTACGGSSSETPEPARPDSWQLKLRYAQREAERTPESNGPEALPVRDLDEPTAAKSTWGGTRRNTKPAPTPSAPTPETQSDKP